MSRYQGKRESHIYLQENIPEDLAGYHLVAWP